MPRKLYIDRQLGWAKRESRFDSALRMTKASMYATKVKNEHERARLVTKLRQLGHLREQVETTSSRALHDTKAEFTRMVATGNVYRKHRFEIYDPYLKEVKPRCTMTVDSLHEKRSKKPDKIRPKHDRPFKDLAPIPEENTRQLSPISKVQDVEGFLTGQNNLTNVRRASIASTNVTINSSHMTANRSRNVSATSRLTDHGSVRSDQLQVKEYAYNRIRRKAKTILMSRDRTIFPGECKSTYEMRKFMEKEASDLIFLFSPEGRRKAQIEELKRQAILPTFVHRSKTMSAILRDYRDYKADTTGVQV